MKKLVCVTLIFLLLLNCAFWPCASATENHCALFESAINVLRWHAPFWDVSVGNAFPVSSIMGYTRQLMCTDEYGETLITDNGYSYYATYAIPAEVFEAAAADAFGIVDPQAMRSYTSFFWDYVNFTGIDDFQNYQPDRDVYLFSSTSGYGDPSRYEVLGYTEEDGLYTVYSRFISLLGGIPEGVEGVDYIRIGEEYYAIDHYLRNVMAISNGHAQFLSWEQLEAVPDKVMTTPLTVVTEDESIRIDVGPGVFPSGTVIEIHSPQPETLQTVQAALEVLATDFVAYEITATAQPNGVVTVTFAIPEGFDPEALALFHISEDGIAQQLEVTVQAEEGTLTAQLTHLSLYAVAQLHKPEPLTGDANGDGAANTRDARLILRYVAGQVEESELDLTVSDVNNDGRINTRDARAILRQVAGLD